MMTQIQSQIAGLAIVGCLFLFHSPAKAGCGDADGEAIICLENSCKYHKVIRECSSAQEGSFYMLDDKSGIGWSSDGNIGYILQKDGGRVQYNRSDWPYRVKLCGDSRGFPFFCTDPKWKINYLK